MNAGQVEFAAESTRGERIKIESGHNIHEERPELVIDAILDVLAP